MKKEWGQWVNSHWLWSVPWVFFSDLTLFVGWQEWHPHYENRHTYSKDFLPECVAGTSYLDNMDGSSVDGALTLLVWQGICLEKLMQLSSSSLLMDPTEPGATPENNDSQTNVNQERKWNNSVFKMPYQKHLIVYQISNKLINVVC